MSGLTSLSQRCFFAASADRFRPDDPHEPFQPKQIVRAVFAVSVRLLRRAGGAASRRNAAPNPAQRLDALIVAAGHIWRWRHHKEASRMAS